MNVLLLNSSFEPLDTISVERAMVLLLNEKVEIIHAAVDKFIHTIKEKYPFPEVVRLKFFVNIHRREMTPTKRNIFDRDKNTCQYCGATKNLTIDHIMPVSRGGQNTWKNLVTCCFKCNNAKGNKTPEEAGMSLNCVPNRPTHLHVIKKHAKDKDMATWESYLFL